MNFSLGWSGNCHCWVLHLPAAKINVISQLSLISQGTHGRSITWDLFFHGRESDLFLLEEILNFTICKNMNLWFLHALCIASPCGFNSCPICCQNSQNLIANQQAILQPRLPRILGSALFGIWRGQSRRYMNPRELEKIVLCGRKRLVSEPKNVSLCLISTTFSVFDLQQTT